jgi:cystathionine beta-lyase
MQSSIFDPVVDRANSNSIKWKLYDPDVLPMWVADMDFKSPPAIIEALRERVEHGVFGYERAPKELELAVVNWCAKQYGWHIDIPDIVFLPGLVSGLNLTARAFGYMGDNATTLTPVYPPFLSAPLNQGLTCNGCQLTLVGEGEHLQYEIDYSAFEKSITPRTHLFYLCHPHNPIGKVFTREELLKLAEICIKHNVLIISDEIHCDLMLDGGKHTPMASLSPEIAEHCVTLMAPSKTFNVPGLGCSFAIVTNKRLRERLQHAEMGIVPHVNALGYTAALAAYTQCDDWLAGLQGYLTENRDVMLDYLAENIPHIRATKPAGTYLGWLDCRNSGISGNPYDFFLKESRVALNSGPLFGPGGEGFVRINFGTPRALMLQGLDRMKIALDKLM